MSINIDKIVDFMAQDILKSWGSNCPVGKIRISMGSSFTMSCFDINSRFVKKYIDELIQHLHEEMRIYTIDCPKGRIADFSTGRCISMLGKDGEKLYTSIMNRYKDFPDAFARRPKIKSKLEKIVEQPPESDFNDIDSF